MSKVCADCKYKNACGDDCRTQPCAGKEAMTYRAGDLPWSRLIFYKPDGRVDRVILRKDLELMSKEQVASLEELKIRSTDAAGSYAVI